MWWMWLVVPSWACDEKTSNTDLEADLTAAATAYADLDRTGFEKSIRDAKTTAGCLGSVILPEHAAALHRTAGLAAYLARDEDLAKRRFAAARSIQRDYVFPDSLVPSGNRALELYQAMDPMRSPLEQLPEPIEGEIWLDGKAQLERRSVLPTVFQHLDSQQEVLVTKLLAGGANAPAYEAKKVPDAGTPKKVTPTVPLLIVAGLLGGGAIAANVAAHTTKKSYTDHLREGSGAEFRSTADSKRSTANALTLTSAGLGVAAVGVGATAVIVGVF